MKTPALIQEIRTRRDGAQKAITALQKTAENLEAETRRLQTCLYEENDGHERGRLAQDLEISQSRRPRIDKEIGELRGVIELCNAEEQVAAERYRELLADRLDLERQLSWNHIDFEVKDQRRRELARTLAQLWTFEKDEKLLAERDRLLAEIQAHSPFHVVKEAMVWQDGKLIPERLSAGAAIVAFGRGVQISKEEARSLGILEA